MASARRYRVYVDAKILNRHQAEGPKETFVGYVVKGRDDLQGFHKVRADETYEAELEAVAFAIRDLQNKLDKFTIVCDHESAVSEIKRKEPRKMIPILKEIRDKTNVPGSLVKVELFAKNPAHSVLNKYLREHVAEQGDP